MSECPVAVSPVKQSRLASGIRVEHSTMTLEQLLERTRTRNIFLSAVAGVVCLLLLVRYFVLPQFEPALSQGVWHIAAKLLEDVSTTIVVTVSVAVFLWWITPARVRNAGIAVVEPRELRGLFADALTHSDQWRFCGGCGRYFRSAVISAMKRRARQESTSKFVAAVILNPCNDQLCETYAKYRSSTRRGQAEGNWTAARVKQELVSTIVITKAAAHEAALVEAQLYLSDQFSGFRVDQSDHWALETREDPTAPALRADAGSYYYSALRDEFNFLRSQATQVNGGEAECAAVKDLASLKAALAALGLRSVNLSDDDLSNAVKTIAAPANPYE